jgi:hypothetical protein
LHLIDPPDAPRLRPEQNVTLTWELISRADKAIGQAQALVRQAAAICEESRLLLEQARARRGKWTPPWR